MVLPAKIILFAKRDIMRRQVSYLFAVVLLLALAVVIGMPAVHGDAGAERAPTRTLPMPESVELSADAWDDVPETPPNPATKDGPPHFDFVLSE